MIQLKILERLVDAHVTVLLLTWYMLKQNPKPSLIISIIPITWSTGAPEHTTFSKSSITIHTYISFKVNTKAVLKPLLF